MHGLENSCSLPLIVRSNQVTTKTTHNKKDTVETVTQLPLVFQIPHM